jgi:hypothetical protein
MPPYPVLCYAPGCPHEAAFKIAARWSDGITGELKTYSLACPGCLPALYQSALTRYAACRLAPDESLSPPRVIEVRHGARDKELVRRQDLEVGAGTVNMSG